MSAGAPSSHPVQLRFVDGTLELRGLPHSRGAALPNGCRWDPRTECFRAPALDYAGLIRHFHAQQIPFDDQARRYGELATGLQIRRAPRTFQSEALAAWQAGHGRGLVVLPTGAGKSHVALLAIDAIRRDTLVVAPTLDLVTQWYDLLRSSFRCEVGVLGGGEHRLASLTVATYDSAFLHMEHLGAKFGLVVFDECHHLPGESFSLAAQAAIAPYRLGLTATPERADGRDSDLTTLVGPTLYRRDIHEMTGDYLADYRVERLYVELTAQERRDYDEARSIYRNFVARQGISMASPDGWSQFVLRSSVSAEGRRAMKAYLRQKELAFAAPSKLEYVEHLLHQHRGDRVLLFSERNNTAYQVANRFLVPVITHHTKVTERSAVLAGFTDGTYNVLATSKVLNEGVDIPAANVGIVVSGSGSVREHVQRLGRLLRKQENKHAVLYELVASDTSEMFTSRRRRAHVAYR